MYYHLFQLLKFQIAATVVMTVLNVFYFLRPKIKIRSTNRFIALMVCSLIYLVFDYLTVFGLVFYDNFPKWVVDCFHRGFIFFLDLTFLYVYVYLEIVSHHQKKLKKGKLVFIGVVMLFAITSLFAPVYYHIDDESVYSYGPMIYSVYLVITTYSVLILGSAIHLLHKNKSNKTALFTLITMGIWIGFAVLQLFKPQALTSSMGVASMILMMYLSLQNPSTYMDKDTDSINHEGLKLTLQDLLYNNKSFHIVNIDMVSFEAIQNQMGEEISNKILNEVKAFIYNTTKIHPFRFSDDSFTILLTTKKQLNKVDNYLKTFEDRFNKRWEVNNNIKIKISAHIDYIRVPEDFDSTGKVADLMTFIQNCHSYSSQNLFVHRVDKELTKNRKHEEAVLNLIKDAIEKDGIEMYYQPIYSTKDKKYTNVEALVRLKDDKTCGYVSPEEFIPLAEKNFLIVDLSDKIFNKIFDFVSKNDIKNLGVKHIEVNLSAVQSVDVGFPEMFMDLFTSYNINPNQINLEVTESVAVSSGIMLKKNMDILKGYGCSFSMDDFGTGYSNLSQIVKTDFELIKVDKSLLWPAFEPNNKDKDKAKILLDSMLKMIKDMGLKIVVEGVENIEQSDYLTKMEVDYIQGYFHSRPIREADYLEFLKKNNTK